MHLYEMFSSGCKQMRANVGRNKGNFILLKAKYKEYIDSITSYWHCAM
jgi:hypothetical protein